MASDRIARIASSVTWAPGEWASMLEQVPLYRDIVRAWNEARIEEDCP